MPSCSSSRWSPSSLVRPFFTLLLIAAAIACSSPPTLPPPDPEVDQESKAFLASLTAGDLGLGRFFADRVQVIGHLEFVGGSGRGTQDVSRQELVEAYARLFDRLRSKGWAKLMEGRRPLINISQKDGHHFDRATAGDYVFELGRPGAGGADRIYVYVFRKIDGKYRIVLHAADY